MEMTERLSGNNRRAGQNRRKFNDPNYGGLEWRSGKDRRQEKKRTLFIRCYNCLMLNRVFEDKLLSKPACGNCKTVLEVPREPEWAKNESFDRVITHWPETLVVVFMAPLCLYSKIVDPVLRGLAREKAGYLKVIKVDTESNKYLTERFKIKKTPTFIVYKNSVEVLRVDGAPKDKTDLVKWVENLIDYTSY